MRRLILFYALVFLISTLACGPRYKDAQMTEELLTLTSGPCESDTASCMEMKLSYFLLTPVSDTAFQHVNTQILEALKSTLSFEKPDDPDITLDQLARKSISDFTTILEEFPNQKARWTQESTLELLYNNGLVLTVRLDEYSYLGGAHPNQFSTLMTFDLFTGEQLDVLPMIIDDFSGFQKLAEQSFRAEKGIDAEQNLNEAGYFWDQQFSLPQNAGIVENGILLYYNTYEVAPYVSGPTTLIFEWDSIRHLADKEILETLGINH